VGIPPRPLPSPSRLGCATESQVSNPRPSFPQLIFQLTSVPSSAIEAASRNDKYSDLTNSRAKSEALDKNIFIHLHRLPILSSYALIFTEDLSILHQERELL